MIMLPDSPAIMISNNSNSAMNRHIVNEMNNSSVSRNKDQKHEASVMLEELAIKISQQKKRNGNIISKT